MSRKGKNSESQNKSESAANESFKSESFVNINTSKLDLLWRYLTQEDVEKLERSNPNQMEKHIAKIFDLNDFEIDLYQAFQVDFYLTQYWWAIKEKNFSFDQTSTYFSIAYILLNNIKDKRMKISDNLDELKNIVSELSVPPRVFNDDQLKDIMDHLNITFFQNYQAFEYAFENVQNEIVLAKQIEVECPIPAETPYPPPLDEAMPEKTYNKYVLKIEDPKEDFENTDGDNPDNIQLSQDIIEQITKKFEGISIDDAKKIIYQVTQELVADLKEDMKNRIKERETALINELSKTNNTAVSKQSLKQNNKK